MVPKCIQRFPGAGIYKVKLQISCYCWEAIWSSLRFLGSSAECFPECNRFEGPAWFPYHSRGHSILQLLSTPHSSDGCHRGTKDCQASTDCVCRLYLHGKEQSSDAKPDSVPQATGALPLALVGAGADSYWVRHNICNEGIYPLIYPAALMPHTTIRCCMFSESSVSLCDH